MTRDAHDNPFTVERKMFTSAVAQLALDGDFLDWGVVRSYKPGPIETRAHLHRKPRPVNGTSWVKWPRHIFRSATGIERAIRKAMNPLTEMDDDQRIRIFTASLYNDPSYLNFDDAEALVKLACLPTRSERG